MAEKAAKVNSFNPRSPCGERPMHPVVDALAVLVSTHAPLAGSDLESASLDVARFMFQPMLPLRGATSPSAAVDDLGDVSTHAPLAGSDHRR